MPVMDNKNFQENAVKLRKERKLTQQEVADRLGISRIAYSKLERGETRLVNESAEKLAELFDMPAEELIYGSRLGERDVPYGADQSARDKEIAVQKDLIRSLQDTVAYQRQLIQLLQEKLEGK